MNEEIKNILSKFDNIDKANLIYIPKCKKEDDIINILGIDKKQKNILEKYNNKEITEENIKRYFYKDIFIEKENFYSKRIYKINDNTYLELFFKKDEFDFPYIKDYIYEEFNLITMNFDDNYSFLIKDNKYLTIKFDLNINEYSIISKNYKKIINQF